MSTIVGFADLRTHLAFVVAFAIPAARGTRAAATMARHLIPFKQ